MGTVKQFECKEFNALAMPEAVEYFDAHNMVQAKRDRLREALKAALTGKEISFKYCGEVRLGVIHDFPLSGHAIEYLRVVVRPLKIGGEPSKKIINIFLKDIRTVREELPL